MNVFTRCCSNCGNFKQQKGGGVRFVLGARQWVCQGCKAMIDKSKD